MNATMHVVGRTKKIIKRRLIILAAVVSTVGTMTALAYTLLKPYYQPGVQDTQPIPVEQKEALPAVAPEKHEPGLPVRLVITGLEVDAKISQVGLTEEGNMDTPLNIMETGWYKYGPHPGDVGSAVIAGHLMGVNGQPGIFGDLDKLKRGDRITVIDDKDQSIAFTVREIRYYGRNEEPSEVFNSSAGAHLNLITCAGNWSEAERTFAKRLVVFSDRAN